IKFKYMKKIAWLVWILITMMTISLVINVKNQFLTLKMAEEENVDLIRKIKKLDETNKNLIKQLEYSTNSAFVDQKARDYFGLGTENDVWLILPPEKKIDINFGQEKKQEIPKFRQWLGLFTE